MVINFFYNKETYVVDTGVAGTGVAGTGVAGTGVAGTVVVLVVDFPGSIQVIIYSGSIVSLYV